MKKITIFALAIVMLIGMALPGYAAVSSPGGVQKPTIIVDPDDPGDALLDPKEVEEQLSEEKKAVFQESFESLQDMDAVLAGLSEEDKQAIQNVLGDEELTAESLTPKYLYYFLPADPSTCPKDVKLDFSKMTDLSLYVQVDGKWQLMENLDAEKLSELGFDLTKCIFMQFVDGKWEVRETVIGDNGIVTVKGMVEGPVCILMVNT